MLLQPNECSNSLKVQCILSRLYFIVYNYTESRLQIKHQYFIINMVQNLTRISILQFYIAIWLHEQYCYYIHCDILMRLYWYHHKSIMNTMITIIICIFHKYLGSNYFNDMYISLFIQNKLSNTVIYIFWMPCTHACSPNFMH